MILRRDTAVMTTSVIMLACVKWLQEHWQGTFAMAAGQAHASDFTHGRTITTVCMPALTSTTKVPLPLQASRSHTASFFKSGRTEAICNGICDTACLLTAY